MKKTLLATALAVGFASAATAQTSVTLYGRVDAGYGYTKYKNKIDPYEDAINPDGSINAGAINRTPTTAKKTGAHEGMKGGNRWGLRGVEDLGDGLKVSFQLESGFNLADGTGRGALFGRKAIVSLSGDSWGKLTYGRYDNLADGYVSEVIFPTGTAFGAGNISNSFSSASVKYDNFFFYETPSFDGFQVGLGYSLNAQGSQKWKYNDGAANPLNPWDLTHVRPDENRKAFSAAMKYENGPLTVAASYDVLYKPKGVETKEFSQAVGVVPPGGLLPGDVVILPVTSTKAGYRSYAPGEEREKDVKAWILGASYDFDVVKVHLGYGQDKNGVFNDREAPSGLTSIAQDAGYIEGYKTNNYSLGVSIPMESSMLRLGWHTSKLKSGKYKDGSVEYNLVKADWDTEEPIAIKSKQTFYTAVYTYDLSKRTSLYAVATQGKGYAFNNMTVTQGVVGLHHQF